MMKLIDVNSVLSEMTETEIFATNKILMLLNFSKVLDFISLNFVIQGSSMLYIREYRSMHVMLQKLHKCV